MRWPIRHHAAERARDADRDRRAPRQATPHVGAATDNVGVTRYNVHRSTTAGFTPSARTASRSRPTPATSTPARRRHLLLPRHGAGRRGQRRSRRRTRRARRSTADTTPPAVSITAPGGRRDRLGHRHGHGERHGQRRRRRRPVQASTARTSEPEDTARPYSLAWDTRAATQRHPHADGGRPRRGRQHGHVEPLQVTVRTPASRTVPPRRYGFDEGAGTTAADCVGQPQHGDARRAPAGRPRAASEARVSLNGTQRGRPAGARHLLQDRASRSRPGCSSSRPRSDVAVVGSWSAVRRRRDDLGRPRRGPYRLTLGTDFGELPRLRAHPTVGRGSTWRRRTTERPPASTSTASLAASTSYTGNVGDTNVWRIGAYGASATGFFDGHVDNLRIYDRALSASEIEIDVASRIQPETARRPR